VVKTKQAVRQTRPRALVLAGGVAANRLLRDRLNAELDVPVLMPPIALCLDNGAMIAAAAASRLEHGLRGTLRAAPNPSLPL
jgi:N6-L-threonylcarbamoyladenine synthase